jgi:hypothetical protein
VRTGRAEAKWRPTGAGCFNLKFGGFAEAWQAWLRPPGADSDQGHRSCKAWARVATSKRPGLSARLAGRARPGNRAGRGVRGPGYQYRDCNVVGAGRRGAAGLRPPDSAVTVTARDWHRRPAPLCHMSAERRGRGTE